MQEIIISWFAGFPKELATFFIAMMPITELRAAIPVAIVKYGMHPLSAWFWATSGSMVIGIITFVLVNPIYKIVISRVDFVHKFWLKYIDKLRRKNEKKFEKWGEFAVVMFVAIPIPLTGAISGAIVASVFGIGFKKAAALLFAGCVLGGVIITTITLIGTKLV